MPQFTTCRPVRAIERVRACEYCETNETRKRRSCWSRRFAAHRDRIKALYDERFCRMWEFYLTVSEIAFRKLDQMVFQIQLARRKDAVPLTRDYISDWEQHQLAQAIPAELKEARNRRRRA